MNYSIKPLRHPAFRHIRKNRENMPVFEWRQFIKLDTGKDTVSRIIF